MHKFKHILAVMPVLLVVGFFLTLTVWGTSFPVAHATPDVLYVKPNGSGDCSSWEQACTLQVALATAHAGDEIWVAQGIYYPGSNRSDTFSLKSGVALYGGFEGTETARDQRKLNHL